MSISKMYQDESFLAELYDLVPSYGKRADIAFYGQLYREIEGRALEAGCGTGRILLPAARDGCHITGIDISAPALQRCREKLAAEAEAVQARVRLRVADLRHFALGGNFQLVTMPFRVFQHLATTEDQIAALRSIRDHLEAGGQLVFDVFHVHFDKLASRKLGEETEDTPELALPDGRKLRRTNRITKHRRAEQYNDVELIYYVTDPAGVTRRLVQAFSMRYYFRYEVEHLLARTGFELVATYGDFDRSPLSDLAPEMIFVALKR